MKKIGFKLYNKIPALSAVVLWWGAALPIFSAEAASKDKPWQWGEDMDPPRKTVERHKEKGSQTGTNKLPAESFAEHDEVEVTGDQRKQSSPMKTGFNKDAKK